MALLPALLMAALMAGGCTVLRPYKIDVVQGNVVTREDAAQLKPGMTKAQVRELIGTPLLNDVFHADRWDYVFTLKRQGVMLPQRRVTLAFKGDVLDHVEAGDLPSGTEFIASIDTGAKGHVPVLMLTGPQIQALPAPAPVAPAPGLPQGAARTYPPLEAQP